MRRIFAAALLYLAALICHVRAVIFYSTGDPTFNTSAPTGSLSGSGWQWVGNWEGFAGTPIGPNCFLAARHVGGNVGDAFVFGGVSYTTTAFFDDTVTDLRICQVSGAFPTWAPIYRGSGEVGQSLVVFGMGLSRGSSVVVGKNPAGWLWGGNGGTLRWGQNTINSVVDGGSYWGQLLYALFNSSGNPDQCQLAVGDSSGPVFINDGSGWQLAGIAAAVDGPFYTTIGGSGFDAALFDARGLYYIDGNGDWDLISGRSPVPSGFYATQVSVRAAWIDSIVQAQDNSTSEPLFSGAQTALFAVGLLGVGAVALRRRAKEA
jgi:hypothetical protein